MPKLFFFGLLKPVFAVKIPQRETGGGAGSGPEKGQLSPGDSHSFIELILDEFSLEVVYLHHEKTWDLQTLKLRK